MAVNWFPTKHSSWKWTRFPFLSKLRLDQHQARRKDTVHLLSEHRLPPLETTSPCDCCLWFFNWLWSIIPSVRWWSSLSRLAGPCWSRRESSTEVWFWLPRLWGSCRWPPACRQRGTRGRQGRPPRVVYRWGGRGDGHFRLFWSFHDYEGVNWVLRGHYQNGSVELT